jgi:hypothetical protein
MSKTVLSPEQLDAEYALELPNRETLDFIAVYVLNGVTICKSFNDLVDAQVACTYALNILQASACKVVQVNH